MRQGLLVWREAVSKFNRDVESALAVTKGAENKYIKMIQINQIWRHPKCMKSIEQLVVWAIALHGMYESKSHFQSRE